MAASRCKLQAALKTCVWHQYVSANIVEAPIPASNSAMDRTMGSGTACVEHILLIMAIFMQAVGQQDLQGLLQTCSASFSRWFMAHLPPLLARHPAAAVLARPLEHFGSDQVGHTS